MRVVLHDEDAQRLGQMLRQHGLPEDVDLSGGGEGLHVVVVLAHAQRAQWAGRRSNPRLRGFTPLLDRLSYRPESFSPTIE